MTTRTFRLHGMGYAATPMTITAKIDGTVVYSGPIPNDSGGMPPLPDPDLTIGEPIFSWTAPVDFAGTWDLEIQATNALEFDGSLYVTFVRANYVVISDPDNPGQFIPGGPNVFGAPFVEIHTDAEGEWTCTQSLTDITVNGVPTGNHATREWRGQPGMLLKPQDIGTAVIHTHAGLASVT